MKTFYIVIAGIIAAIIWDLIFVRKLVTHWATHLPNDYDYRSKVKATAYLAAAIAFLPSLIFGGYVGVILGSLLMKQTWLAVHDGAVGANLGIGIGLAVASAGFTILATYLAVRVFAPVPREST